MLNKFVIQGRISRDPQIKDNNKVKIAYVNVACNSGEVKNKVNFIDIKAFGKNAELVEQYLPKGTPAVFEGYTSSGSYEKDGKKVFTQDLIVSKIHFFGNKELNSKESNDEDLDTLLFN